MAQNKQNESTKGGDTSASASASTGGDTAAATTLSAAREQRAKDMSVAGKKEGAKAGKAAAEKKPAFVVNEKERDRLLALSDEELIAEAADKLRPTDASNLDIYRPTGNTQDNLNGQDVSRSQVRSAVLHFLNSRRGKKAPVNVICAYMALASGSAYKGKFDFGYLTTKDGGDGKRGMVARKLIELVERGAKPAKEEAATA